MLTFHTTILGAFCLVFAVHVKCINGFVNIQSSRTLSIETLTLTHRTSSQLAAQSFSYIERKRLHQLYHSSMDNNSNDKGNDYVKNIIDPKEDLSLEMETIPPVSRRGFLTAMAVSSLAYQPTTAYAADENETTKPSTILKSSPKSSRNNPLEEAISGMIAGSSLTVTKTLVKYPLDTATVRLQMPSSTYSITNLPELFRGSFRGITTPLLSNIPAGAVFFAVKDSSKTFILENPMTAGLPKWLITTLAVSVALPPYWFVRNPSEVVKTRQQAGIEGYGEGVNAVDAFKLVYEQEMEKNKNKSKNQGKETSNEISSMASAIGGFYSGYGENMLYALPADVIKFVVYDGYTSNLKSKRRQATGNPKAGLSPLESALLGACATAVAQLVTTPLDVVRNRVMAKGSVTESTTTSSNSSSSKDEGKEDRDTSYWGSLVSLAREEGLPGLFAGASPRVGKAFLSGAIQFATYEETKTSIAKFFDRKS